MVLSREIQEALGRLNAKVNRALNIRGDGTVSVLQEPDGVVVYVPEPPGILAVITGGTNPYSWLSVTTFPNGVIDTDSFSLNNPPLEGTTTESSAGSTPVFRPAWELNGNRDVLPGTLVWLEPRYLNPDSDVEEEYTFNFRDGPLPAQVTQLDSPTTTLNGGINSSVTSLVPAAFAGFPVRDFWRVLIDSEVLEVTAGTGTLAWTVARAQDGTTAAAHSNGATIKLVGNYRWQEQRPPVTGNDLWRAQTGVPRSGTYLDEDAIERNHNCFVPDGTYVLVWRKYTDGAGASSLVFDITSADIVIVLTTVIGFPSQVPFHVRVQGEYMNVTNVTGTTPATLTVDRGRYLSQATQHEAGSDVVEAVCEWTFDYCCTNTGGGSNTTASVRWLPFEYNFNTATYNSYAFNASVSGTPMNKAVATAVLAGGVTINGISTAGFLVGDQVRIENHSSENIYISSDSASAVAGERIEIAPKYGLFPGLNQQITVRANGGGVVLERTTPGYQAMSGYGWVEEYNYPVDFDPAPAAAVGFAAASGTSDEPSRSDHAHGYALQSHVNSLALNGAPGIATLNPQAGGFAGVATKVIVTTGDDADLTLRGINDGTLSGLPESGKGKHLLIVNERATSTVFFQNDNGAVAAQGVLTKSGRTLAVPPGGATLMEWDPAVLSGGRWTEMLTDTGYSRARYRSLRVSLPGGTYNNFNMDGYSELVFVGGDGGTVTLTGISATNVSDGEIRYIENQMTNATVVVKNQANTNSSPTNCIAAISDHASLSSVGTIPTRDVWLPSAASYNEGGTNNPYQPGSLMIVKYDGLVLLWREVETQLPPSATWNTFDSNPNTNTVLDTNLLWTNTAVVSVLQVPGIYAVSFDIEGNMTYGSTASGTVGLRTRLFCSTNGQAIGIERSLYADVVDVLGHTGGMQVVPVVTPPISLVVQVQTIVGTGYTPGGTNSVVGPGSITAFRLNK